MTKRTGAKRSIEKVLVLRRVDGDGTGSRKVGEEQQAWNSGNDDGGERGGGRE